MDDLICIDPEILSRWNCSVPRYTSYPTAPQFHAVDSGVYQNALDSFAQSKKLLSLYIHIPFCRTMCLFCGCSVVLNRNPQRQKTYLDHLLQEIALLSWGEKRKVSQLHFGGGTPTSLTEEEFEELMRALQQRYIFAEDAEISIEVDPRTVYADQGKKLKFLHSLGFNRISFGVQDLDPVVQEAVKRRQTEEMTVQTYEMARAVGFKGINLDLIYGLPFQTRESFRRTATKIAELKPDRISLFSYAKIPWLKGHQKAIKEETLPKDSEKFQIYIEAREIFMRSGYVAIGMDHFALQEDSLAYGYRNQQLTRNFQGYSLDLAEDMIGFGITSIGFLENIYFQNVKSLEDYARLIQSKEFPIYRGYVLQKEDRLRKWVIQTMMCHFMVDKQEFERRFFVSFDLHFMKERSEIDRLKREGLLEETQDFLMPTAIGRLFIRIVASVFDAYLGQGQYSRAI